MATLSTETGPLPETSDALTTYPHRGILVVWLALVGASLSRAMLIEGISIGDVLFGCAAAACLLRLFKNPRPPYVPIWSVYIILLIMWAGAGGLFMSSTSNPVFSEIEFWKSFVKLSFYGFGAILLGSYIRGMEAAMIGKVVFNNLTLHAAIALYIYVAQVLGQLSGVHIPHAFFWFGQGGPLAFGGELVTATVDSVVLYRARGIFNEPSTFGLFQTLGLAFVLFRTSQPITTSVWKYVVILTSLLLTFSLTTFGLLAVLLVLWVLTRKQVAWWKTALKVILGIVVVISLVFSFVPTSFLHAFSEAVVHRSVRVAQLQDYSGTARMIASWDVARSTISNSPVFGSGIGNLEATFLHGGSYSSLISQKILAGGLQGSTAAFNILLAVLGSLGIGGFLIFLVLIAHPIIIAPAAGIVLLVSTFGTGIFLGPVFWVYYVLLATRVYD